MTEEEAKTKWCPMARYPQATSEPSPSSNYSATCIGTACMMWRWDDVDNPAYSPFMRQMLSSGQQVPSHIKSETDGHCGLAHG